MKLPVMIEPDRSGARFEVRSPVDRSIVANAPDASPAEVDAAVERARTGGEQLAGMTAFERGEILRRAAASLTALTEDIAEVVAWETGRPLASGRDEVGKAASGLVLAAEEGERLAGEVVPVRAGDRHTFTTRHPLGVWAVLSPWNFPVNIPIEYLGPAIATGNGAVWKPAPSTIGSASLVMRALREAGLPDGAVTLLPTDRIDTASELVSHPGVAGVGLTGSTATGNAVQALASGKELIFELGGNGPVLVYSDADLPRAAAAIAASGFSASGQICSSTGRVLADPSVVDELARLIASESTAYRLGDPFDPETVIGPVHDDGIATRVRERIASALDAGARALTDEDATPRPTECYLAPQVIVGVPLGHALEAEESFGPVVPIVAVSDDELVSVANASPHALSVAVFTSDYRRAMLAADRLRYGSVVVNDRPSYWELHLPFGGWHGRASGGGRVGVPEVVRRMTQTRTTTFAW